MSGPDYCAQCGEALVGDVLQGLCLRCVARQMGNVLVAQAPPSTTSQPLSNRTFGDYELVEEIARGGMGVVWKARQIPLSRTVAVKLLLSGRFSRAEFVKRFHAEAEAVAQLRHPNIVAIYEVGEQEGQHYFSMEYVEGQSLAERARDNPLPPELAADYLKTIAEAIHYAHQRGILHRDLKPSNILIDNCDQPRITDFGLAKRLHEDSDLTLPGQLLGTPQYISPEQADGRLGAVTVASDIYSLGAILYYLLTGRPPFRAETTVETLRQVCEQEPTAPHTLNPEVDRDLEIICLKCLNKDPQRPYGSAEMLAEDLDRWRKGEPINARPVSSAEKVWRWCRRNPLVAIFAATSLFLLLFTAIGSGIAAWRIHHSRKVLAEHLYAADMKLAERYLAEGHWGRARQLLASYANPDAGALRGFEWGYFRRIAEGEQLETVFAHSNRIAGIAFLPDRSAVASLSEDNKLKLWQFPEMRLKASFDLGEIYPSDLTYSSKRQLLAAATEAKGVFVWRAGTGELVAHLPGQWVRAVFAPAQDVLLVCGGHPIASSTPGRVALWSPSAAKEVDCPVTGTRVEWSPDGKAAFVSSGTGSVATVEVSTGRIVRRFDNAGFVTTLACSPDGKVLGSANWSDQVHLWDTATGLRRHELRGHGRIVWKMAFSPDSRWVATSSSDQTVRLWNVADGHCVKTYYGHGNEVWWVEFSPDGEKLVSGDKDGTVLVWDRPKEPVNRFDPNVSSIAGRPVFSADGKLLALGVGDGRVQVIDLATKLVRYEVLQADCPLAFSKDAQTLLLLATTEIRRIGFPSLKVLESHPLSPAVTHLDYLALSADQRLLASLREPGEVGLWDTGSGVMIESIRLGEPRRVRGLNFSPDNKSLVVCPWDSRDVQVYFEGWKRKRYLKGHKMEVWDASFSPDGKLLATASMDDTAIIWDFRSGRLLQPLGGHRQGAMGIAFSPDSRTLAVVSGDTQQQIIKLWNLPTYREVADLRVNKRVEFLSFSPSGHTLVAWSTGHRDVEFWQSAARDP